MQPVALQQPVEGGAIDARGPGGSGHVAARLRHELAEVAELELGDKTITRVVVRLFGRDLAQQRRRRLGRELVAEGRNGVRRDLVTRLQQDDQVFDDVLELAHVALPGARAQCPQRRLAQPRDGHGRASGNAAQLTATSGRLLRRLWWWMNWAINSLPGPLSPVMKTEASVGATRRARPTARRNAGDAPSTVTCSLFPCSRSNSAWTARDSRATVTVWAARPTRICRCVAENGLGR